MYQVKVNHTFCFQTFKAASLQAAEELKARLYDAFADGGCWLPLDNIEIIDPHTPQP